MWVAAERPPRTRAARLFVFSRTCVIISKPVTPCKTFRGNMAEFFNRLLGVYIGEPTVFALGIAHEKNWVGNRRFPTPRTGKLCESACHPIPNGSPSNEQSEKN